MSTDAQGTRGPTGKPVEWASLAALLAFTLVSVGGYWNFALHPERIPGGPAATAFFRISFGFFAQIHILLAAACLGVVLVGRAGARWLPALVAVYALAFAAEHVGTGYGVPFGGYQYGGLLGVKLGGRVPALIPVSWFLMALPSWVLARHALPDRRRRIPRILLGAGWMVVWDLALDPAMSFLTPYWRWEHAGPYYGMPVLNLLGWSVTAAVLMATLEALADRTGIADLPPGWMTGYWVVVLLMPLGMVLAAGLWPAVLATLVAGAALGVVTGLCAPSSSSPQGPMETVGRATSGPEGSTTARGAATVVTAGQGAP